MTASEIVKLVISIVDIIAGLVVIAVVMLQSGKSAGLSGSIGGGATALMSKTKAKGWDAKLARMTKWVAICWIILTLILTLM